MSIMSRRFWSPRLAPSNMETGDLVAQLAELMADVKETKKEIRYHHTSLTALSKQPINQVIKSREHRDAVKRAYDRILRRRARISIVKAELTERGSR